MTTEFLYGHSEWLIILAFFAVLLLATEAGFRLGRASRSPQDEARRSQVSNIQGAILALLGLLLAFTFSMAVSRFDTRKQLVLEEANAIGTASLRGRLLAEPRQTEFARLIREYVEARLEVEQADESPPNASEKVEHLQDQLWSLAVVESETDRRAVTNGLVLQALNDVFDVETKRRTAAMNHVPETVVFLLFVFAMLAVAGIGYGCGLGNSRNVFSTLTFSVLIVLVVLVIVDLDRPRRGLIKVSERNIINLRDRLNKARP